MTVYERNIVEMSDAQLHALVFHELLHIDETFTKIVKHDLEDFKVIIDVLGTDWDTNPDVKDILDGSNEDTVTEVEENNDEETELI